MSITFSYSFTVNSGTTVRPDHINNLRDAVITGFESVESELGKTLRFDADVSAIAFGANYSETIIGFDENSNPVLYDISIFDDAVTATGNNAATASTQAGIATTKAAESSSSATSASSSASTATTKANEASTSASNASASATASETSRSAAEAIVATVPDLIAGKLDTDGIAADSSKVGGHSVWSGTQAAYDALGPVDASTLYFIAG